MVFSSIPIGKSCSISFKCSATASPTATTSSFAPVATPIPMARLPSTRRRVHIASFDGCDITQAYFASTLCHDQLVAYILYTFISTFGTYTKLVGPGHDLTRIDQQVLGLQDLLNRIRIDPQVRQLGNFDPQVRHSRPASVPQTDRPSAHPE